MYLSNVSLVSHRSSYNFSDLKDTSRTDLERVWIIITLGGAIFAGRHFELAGKNPEQSFGHQLLGYLESMPILGGVVAAIRACDRCGRSPAGHRPAPRR